MLIDWFTVGAQAVNFIILVWLLKRFLYKPVLAAVDARETKIAAELADAAANKADAQKERDAFAQKNAAFDQNHAALMEKATSDAVAERQSLLDDAGKAADALAAKRHDALQRESVTLNKAIRHLTQREVFAIARKALSDLASASLDEAMVAQFARQLGTMDKDAREHLGKAIKATTGPLIIRSAFDLPDAQQASVKQALHEAFAVDGPVRFETAPDLVGGIELNTGGQKIAWSIAGYLAAMEQSVDALVTAEAAKTLDAPANGKPGPRAKSATRHAAAHKAAHA
jgi:F-type H+-transporting ATPase subunit b